MAPYGSGESTANQYQTGAHAQAGVWVSGHNDPIRVPEDVEAKIRDMAPREYPFTNLLDEINESLGSDQFEFQWMEEWPIQTEGTVVGAIAAATTAVVVDNAEIVLPGDSIFISRTKEMIRVVSRVIATNTLTVIRGINSLAKAILAGDAMIILGNATEEAQDPVEMLMRGTDHGKLWLQQITSAAGLSLWEKITAKRGIGELERLDQQQLKRHRKMREHYGVLGQPGPFVNPANGQKTFYQAGLLWLCGQRNKVNMNGRISYDAVARAFSHIFEHGDSDVRWGFTSKRQKFNFIGLREVRDTIVRDERSKTVGFEIDEVSFPGGGRVKLVELPVLNKRNLDQIMIVCSLADVRRRFLNGYDGLHIDNNIQTKGSFREEWQLTQIQGLDITNAAAAGVLYNMG